MKKYIAPSLELQTFSSGDIMNTSGNNIDVKFGGLGTINYAGDSLDFSDIYG